MYGQLTVNSVDYWPYDKIRNINLAIEKVETGSIGDDLKRLIKSEALFFRAFQYFELVKRYGGVPLVLKVQTLADDLFVSRNSTSECFAQIVFDLDGAIKGLPAYQTGANAGRLTRSAAMAFKGRVLLFWASPQYNRDNNLSRWQKAYEANKQAKDSLDANGYGLYPEFANIWFDEMNKEDVFVNRYLEPNRFHAWDAATRPLDEAVDNTGGNMPTLEMVNSFAMKNGLAINNPASGYDASEFWKNRDPRFDKTIVINGSLYELSGKTGRIQWTYIGGEKNGGTATGFYMRKGVNLSYSPYFSKRSSTDYVDLRYAEVMLNLAECAAEVGRPDEAYALLKEIRKRAGILPGTEGVFGLQPNLVKEDLVKAVMLERKVELAFEGKRYWDMRRRMLFDTDLNGLRRHGYRIRLIAGKENEFNAIKQNFNLDDYFKYFVNEEKILDETFAISYKPEYYFFAIPMKHLEKNPNLKQTKGWDGGVFDPLL